MPTQDEKDNYKQQLDATIEQTLEQLAMLHYDKKIKGCLVLVIDHNHIFRLMEAYGSDTAFSMNAAIDIAKDNIVTVMKRNLTEPKKD